MHVGEIRLTNLLSGKSGIPEIIYQMVRERIHSSLLDYSCKPKTPASSGGESLKKLLYYARYTMLRSILRCISILMDNENQIWRVFKGICRNELKRIRK